MGEKRVSRLTKPSELQRFNRRLLDDIQAMQYMLDHDWYEDDIVRIGAEQEIALVHRDTLKPATVAMDILSKIGHHPWITTELAAFNLEANLPPYELKGDCFARSETELLGYLKIIQESLHSINADYVLTGILPTLRKNDLVMANLTPKERYFALMDTLTELKHGQAFELRLTGID
jgi:hypothetical protein